MNELNYLVAFSSGIVSFFAPCVVPLLPAYVGYVTGVSLRELQAEGGADKYRSQIILSSIMFMLGFAVIFVILGSTAAGLASLIRMNDIIIQRLGGIIVMVFALSFMDVLPFGKFAQGLQFQMPAWANKLGYGRAFIVGLVFATAWTPCVGAVLGAILTLAAASGTATTGAIMLFIYSLGISIPFFVISLTIAHVPAFLKAITKYLATFSKVAGVLLFIVGFLLFNNTLGWIHPILTYNHLNSWLFEVAFSLGFEIR